MKIIGFYRGNFAIGVYTPARGGTYPFPPISCRSHGKLPRLHSPRRPRSAGFFFPTGQKHMVIAKNQFYKHTVCIYSSPKTLFVVFKQTNKEREIDHWFWSNDTACILIQTE